MADEKPQQQPPQLQLQISLDDATANGVLLVGLANIIMDRALISDNATAASSAASVAAAKVSPDAVQTPANDPLADIGVVPDMPAAESPATGASRGPGAAARRPGG